MAADSGRALVVLTATGGEEQANTLAEALIARHLAACVNIVPAVRSIYRWQGKVERASEWLLVIKTKAAAYDALAAAIRELHSYDTPEILALGVDRGNKRYLDWLASNVRPAAKTRRKRTSN